jgi:hypothetical protein
LRSFDKLTKGDRVACVAALLPLLVYGIQGNYEQPDLPHLGMLLGGTACFAGAIAHQRWAPFGVLACALAVGCYERMLNSPFNGNDVMLATNEALGVLASGANPYAHVYTTTNPPGQPFAYPPGELLFYGLGKLATGSIFGLDRWAGIANLFALAALFPIAGASLAALAVSVAAIAAPLAFSAANGSNDTVASFLALVAIVLLAGALAVRNVRLERALWWTSAVAFGWAIVFKETTALVYVAVLAYLIRERSDWHRYAIGSLGPAAALVLPFVIWDPSGLWRNVVAGLFVHTNIWGRNVWGLLTAVAPGARDAVARLVPTVMLLAFWLTAYFCARSPARSLGGAVLQGCALLGALFLFGRWTTSTYYVQLVPLVLAGAALTLADRGVGPRSSIVSTQ